MAVTLAAEGRIGRELVESSTGIVKAAFAKAERVLTSDRDIRVKLIRSQNPDVSVYMGGASGWASSEDRVDIYIDPRAPGWTRALSRAFIHEFNHTIRHQRFKKPFKDYSLVDTIASEGLAQCFEKEVCGSLPPYAKAVSKGEAGKVWGKLKPHLLEKNNTLWRRAFFATDDPEFRHWSGYTLSYLIIRKRALASGFEWPRIMRTKSNSLVGGGLG